MGSGGGVAAAAGRRGGGAESGTGRRGGRGPCGVRGQSSAGGSERTFEKFVPLRGPIWRAERAERGVESTRERVELLVARPRPFLGRGHHAIRLVALGGTGRRRCHRFDPTPPHRVKRPSRRALPVESHHLVVLQIAPLAPRRRRRLLAPHEAAPLAGRDPARLVEVEGLPQGLQSRLGKLLRREPELRAQQPAELVETNRSRPVNVNRLEQRIPRRVRPESLRVGERREPRVQAMRQRAHLVFTRRLDVGKHRQHLRLLGRIRSAYRELPLARLLEGLKLCLSRNLPLHLREPLAALGRCLDSISPVVHRISTPATGAVHRRRSGPTAARRRRDRRQHHLLGVGHVAL